MHFNVPHIATWKWRLLSTYQTARNRILMKQADVRPKVFCIGLNKTGTTSWAYAMAELGYIVGSETKATMFFDDWVRKDFSRIIDYCRTQGQAFQDIPFNLPGTYREMDHAFPESKFVLTVRDTADAWFHSLINFHGKYWSLSGHIPPTTEDLARAVYWRRGFLADYCREVFKTPISDPYNRELLLDFYNDYNKEVVNYFTDRPGDFLVLNVSQAGAHYRPCGVLGLPSRKKQIPPLNKT